MDASAAHSDAELHKALSLGLPRPPARIRVTAAPSNEHGGPNHYPSTTYSSCCSPELVQPLMECPPTPHSRGSSRGSFCSDTSADLWISAVVPGHPEDSPLADSAHSTWKQPGCGRADSLNSPPSNWGTAKPQQLASPAACTKAPTAWDVAGSGLEAASVQGSTEGWQQDGHAEGPAVALVATPMQDLSTLLTGCPPGLHIAFAQTAAALADQHQQQHQQLQQQLVLAQDGYTTLEQPHLEQLLLQQQQGHRYNLVPIAALPMLLAAAVPHWSGADVGYAALQIRCHLNVICDFSLDTPKAQAAFSTPPALPKGGSESVNNVSFSCSGHSRRGSSGSSNRLSSRSSWEDVTGQAAVPAVPAAPCDLMYAELASTILAAAATEAAVGQQQLPPAVQGLLVDFTAELSSNAELVGKLHEVFAQEAAAEAAVQTVPSLQQPRQHSSGDAQGAVVMQKTAAAAAAEAQVPVVKAVKLLCKLLVGPTGLSDIRLLAWLTCLVWQQHLANQQHGLQAAAAAAASSPAAVISCDQLLHVLSQLLEQLTGAHGDETPPPPSYEASEFYPPSEPTSPTGYSPHTCPFGDHSTIGDVYSSSALQLQGQQQCWPGDDSQWELGKRRARQQYRSSSGSALPSEGSTFSCPDSPRGWMPLQGSSAVDVNGTPAAAAAAVGGSISPDSRSVPTAVVDADVQHELTAWWGVGDMSIGRAAHRPISASSSFGVDVWSVVAALAAGDTSLLPEQHLLVPQQLQGLALTSGQPTFGPPRALRHQNSWPGRQGHSSGSNGGSNGGSAGSSGSTGRSRSDGGSGGNNGSSGGRSSVGALDGSNGSRSSAGSNGGRSGSSGGSSDKALSRSSSSQRSSRLSRMSLPGMAAGGTYIPPDNSDSAGSISQATMFHNAVWEGAFRGHPIAEQVFIPAVRPVKLHGSSHLSMLKPHLEQQRQLQQLQQEEEEQHERLLAQQHAWQAEMLMVHQPWEGAVSPIAACRNWGPFSATECGQGAAAESGQGSAREAFGSFVVEGSGDGRSLVREVQILRISSGSYMSCESLGEGGDGLGEWSGC